MFAERSQILLSVAEARHQHISQPEGPSVFFQPCRRCERLRVRAPVMCSCCAERISFTSSNTRSVSFSSASTSLFPDAAVRVHADMQSLFMQATEKWQQRLWPARSVRRPRTSRRRVFREERLQRFRLFHDIVGAWSVCFVRWLQSCRGWRNRGSGRGSPCRKTTYRQSRAVESAG